MVAPRPLFSGIVRLELAATRFEIGETAASMVTPGFRRPTPMYSQLPRLPSAGERTARRRPPQSSHGVPGGSTPTTSCGWPSRVIVRPTIAGSAPNRSRPEPCDSRTRVRRRAGIVFARHEQAAGHGADAKRAEEPDAHVRAAHALGRIAAGQREARAVQGAELVERAIESRMSQKFASVSDIVVQRATASFRAPARCVPARETAAASAARRRRR